MRYLCSVIFCFLLFNSMGYAQTDTLGVASGLTSQTAKMEELLGKLQIYQDPRITDLLVRHSQINQRKQAIDGYRLEIFFSSESNARQHSVRVKNDFNLVFPTIPSYMLFQTPNFKVRIGDFRNKSEALKAKAYIASKYPNAFIVKDNIRYPEIYPERVEQTEEQ
jgi:hypothetical protein